jgi:hypothetical protein
MKTFLNIKQFNNIFVITLIVFFICLIIYQLYLAINNNKFHRNYSKLIEGLGNITPQGNIDCSFNNLPNNIYNVIITDISNIQMLYNEVNNSGNQVIQMITNYNSNPSNTSITTPTLNTISSPTISSSSDASGFCSAINQNVTNISTIYNNMQNIITSAQLLPNGQTEVNNSVFQSLTNNNTVSPFSPASSVPISTLCQTENTNIGNINVLSGNTTSLNNLVTNLQTAQNNLSNNQYNTASTISSSVGINS